MVTETVKFNHSAGTIPAVFGISKQRAMEITGSMFFIEIDKAMTAQSLYDDPSEAPAEFTTHTGVLDAMLGEVKNDNEALFATYEWSKHITLSNTDKNYKEMVPMMTMLYMLSGQDKDKFVKRFVEGSQESEN